MHAHVVQTETKLQLWIELPYYLALNSALSPQLTHLHRV